MRVVLSKWYADVVTDDGRTAIAYWGALDLWGVRARVAVTIVPGAPAPDLARPTLAALAAITAFSALAYAAYGMDFPRLNVRFSRLV